MNRRSHKLEFPNAAGELLAGRLETADGSTRGCALFAHCFTCSKDIAAAGRISRALAERGITVLRFDFTGLGNSEGDFGNTNFSSNVTDLVAAADYLREHEGAPRLLVGHSLGGAAVLAAAGRIPEARAVATIGSPATPEHVRRLLRPAIPEIERRGEALVRLGGREFPIRKQFLDDLQSHGLDERIGLLRRALLVMHSPVDEVVSVDEARRIFEAAKHPKSFVSLDDADHLLARRDDSEFVAAILAAWASRYMDERPLPPSSPTTTLSSPGS